MLDAEQIYRKASMLDAGRLQVLAEFLEFLLARESATTDGKPLSPPTVESPHGPSVHIEPVRTSEPTRDARDRQGTERASRAAPSTEIGRTLRAIRQRAIDRGMPLQSVDDILAEVREGRAEAGDDQDLH